MVNKGDVIREGLIIRVTEMKERDAMARAIGPDGFFSFYAYGVKKLGSSNASAVQLLSHGEYVLHERSEDFLALKEASPRALYLPNENLSAMVIASLLVELANVFVQEDEAPKAYPWILGALKTMKESGDAFTPGLICFAHLLALGGIGLDLDECVICGSKSKIEGISFEDGGFVCPDCFESDRMEKPSRDVLKMYRYIFKAPLSDYGRVRFEETACLPLYMRLGAYLEAMTGIKLRALELLRRA